MFNKFYLKLLSVSLLMLLMVGCSVTQRTFKLDSIEVYKSFPKAGTTADINFAFLNPGERNVNTSVGDILIDPKLFEQLINTSRQKKHLQRKLTGITFAGEFFSNEVKHFFIFFKDANLIIDLTDKREYWLQKPLQYVD